MFESDIMLLHYRASAGFSLRSSTLAKYRKVLWRFVMAPFHYFFTKLCSYNSTKLVTAQITFQHNRCTFNICGTLKVRHPQPLPDFPKWRRQHQLAVKRSHSRRRCHKSHLPKTPSKATTQHLRARTRRPETHILAWRKHPQRLPSPTPRPPYLQHGAVQGMAVSTLMAQWRIRKDSYLRENQQEIQHRRSPPHLSLALHRDRPPFLQPQHIPEPPVLRWTRLPR